MLLPDHEIEDLVRYGSLKIEPFIDDWRKVWKGSCKPVSFGLTSSGYDIRLSPNGIKVFREHRFGDDVLHPKKDNSWAFDLVMPVETEYGLEYRIPPRTTFLAESVEWFEFPKFVTGVCKSKSTYARLGEPTLVSPLEPGWAGTVTLEFQNSTPQTAVMMANEGCIQVQFYKHNSCRKDYAERSGRYQNQSGITLPRGFE